MQYLNEPPRGAIAHRWKKLVHNLSPDYIFQINLSSVQHKRCYFEKLLICVLAMEVNGCQYYLVTNILQNILCPAEEVIQIWNEFIIV